MKYILFILGLKALKQIILDINSVLLMFWLGIYKKLQFIANIKMYIVSEFIYYYEIKVSIHFFTQ